MKSKNSKMKKICFTNTDCFHCCNSDRMEIDVEIIKINQGDILLMKKEHPCGGNLFKVMRVGSDVRIVCIKCGRDLTLSRVKLEKSIKKVNP